MRHHRVRDLRNYTFLLVSVIVSITAPVWIAGLLNRSNSSGLTVVQANNQSTPHAAYALIQVNRGNPNFIILDVRTPEEYSEGHLEEAINLDYYQAMFRQELDPLDRTKTYLVYCRSGVRSNRTWALMHSMGFQQVYNLARGVEEWHRQGFRTVRYRR